MFSKSTLGIWLDSESVALVLYKKDKERKLVHSGPLNDFLRNHSLEKYRGKIDNVAIVLPDDWINKTFFPFHSPKKKYIKPFLLRQLKKLTDQDEHLPDYHYYFLADGLNEEKGIYVYYLTRKDCLETIRQIDAAGFNITMITTPGLLWGEKLKGVFKKQHVNNVALLIHHEEECHLFFYHNRSFTFSRGFDLGEYSQKDEAFQSLVFEINQSLIYFSQQCKSEVELLMVIDSSTYDDFASMLKESIGKEVLKLDGRNARKCSGGANEGIVSAKIDHWTYFCESDFLDTARAPNLLPENELKNVCFSCFQRAGVVVGAVLFLILMVQVCWMQLQYMSLSKQLETHAKTVVSQLDSILNKWNDASNAIIDKAMRPSVSSFLSQLAHKDIPFLQLNQLKFDLYTDREIKVEGTFRTEDARIFKTGMETLMDEIRSVIPSGKKLTWQNVTFQRDFTDNEKKGYSFEIRVEL